jgi:hypothetical protein
VGQVAGLGIESMAGDEVLAIPVGVRDTLG